MALTSLQLCQKCSSLLRMRRSPVELVVRAKAQYPVNVSGSSIFPRCSTDPRLPLASLNRSLLAQKCRGKWISRSRTFSDWCSTALPSREDQRQPGDLTEHSLVPNQRCESDQATVDVLSLSDCQMSLGDLDSAAALSPFDDIDDEEAVKINGQPALPPVAISLRDYVSQSETLRQLVLLGVNLSKLEQRLNVGSMLLRLDFQEDVRERLLFLKDVGVKDSELGPLITRNPFVLTESLENLEARVLFLKSQKFSQEAIAAMVYKAPYLLNFSIQRLDNRLAFFQKSLGLSAQKTVDIMTRLPRLLCRSLEPVKENLKVFELELGFRENEIQHIVTRIPKVLTANKKRLTETFYYIHKTMGIPHSLIVKFPQVLNSKLLRIKERHLFLHYLGRAQYDPTQPSYIALEHLVSLPDEVFCTKVALASLEDFELFLKTL